MDYHEHIARAVTKEASPLGRGTLVMASSPLRVSHVTRSDDLPLVRNKGMLRRRWYGLPLVLLVRPPRIAILQTRVVVLQLRVAVVVAGLVFEVVEVFSYYDG